MYLKARAGRDGKSSAGVPDKVIAISPSCGLGGGIESYTEAVLARVQDRGVRIERHALLGPGTREMPTRRQKASYVVRVVRGAFAMRASQRPGVYVFHPGFALLGALVRVIAGSVYWDSVVFFHGQEIWSSSWIERLVWRHCGMRRITVSAFSAGALAATGPASVLPPGIPEERYWQLKAIGDERKGCPTTGALKLLSVFRLDVSCGKGVPELLRALDRLRARGLCFELTIAGMGPAPDWLCKAVRQRCGWVRLVESPDGEHLGKLLSASDLFVLATRFDPESGSGEGFGIVLLEAALCGMAVVAPAADGSSDATLPGITGVRPVDGSMGALENVLEWCARYRDELTEMGRNGNIWVSTVFSPSAYSRRVGQVLFGEQPSPSTPRLEIWQGG